MEESEASRSSSQVSFSKHDKNGALTFYKDETAVAESKLVDDLDDKTETFTNRSALDLESGKVTEEELVDENAMEELPGRGAVITTSFRNVVPISKFGGSEGARPSDSPLLRYVPRSTPISPAEVKGE